MKTLLYCCIAAVAWMPTMGTAEETSQDTVEETSESAPVTPTRLSAILKNVGPLSALLEAAGRSGLSLKGLVQPEKLGFDLGVLGEASNNQVDALNHNRVNVLSGNSLKRSYNLFGELHIHVTLPSLPQDGPPPELSVKPKPVQTGADKPGTKQKQRELERLRKEFEALDSDGDGQISWDEFRAGRQSKRQPKKPLSTDP